MLNQGCTMFDPVAVIIIGDAIDLAHFGIVDVATNHAIDLAHARFVRDHFLEHHHADAARNPVAYAPFIRKDPLHGNAAKPVIFQFAFGDQTVPNPTTTAILALTGFLRFVDGRPEMF